MATTADLAAAREAIATHIFLCEDPLNHREAMELLDAYANTAFEVGRSAERAARAGKPVPSLPKSAVLSAWMSRRSTGIL